MIAIGLFVCLRLWRKDLTVPFVFFGDALSVSTYVKTIVDQGWWWHCARLSAPFSLSLVSIPANAEVDFFLVWAVSLFSHNFGVVLNFAWFLMFFIGGATAMLSLRALGARRFPAFVLGTLYPFLPFAFYRSVAHLILSFYLVPVACLLCILLAAGQRELITRKRAIAGLAVFALLGFNYVYDAFFAGFLLIVAVAAGYIRTRSRHTLRLGGAALAILVVCTAVNMAPSVYAWHKYGRPGGIDFKSAVEADVYGLRIRHLLSPVPGHTFPFLRTWDQHDAAVFRDRNESRYASLGTVGAAGFLVLLAVLLFPGAASRYDESRILTSTAQLNMAAVLLATVGGFGSLFNLLVLPDFRCYNRISVFIAFFSFVAVAHVLTSMRFTRWRAGSLLVPSLGSVILLWGMYDQSQTARSLAGLYPTDAAAHRLEAFVQGVERRFPAGAMMWELPLTPYPVDPGTARMGVYEHARPYLYSRSLRWSWPPGTSENWNAWYEGIGPLPLPAQVDALVLSGFDGIWVDRTGYADSGAGIEGQLQVLAGQPVAVSPDARYAVYDLRAIQARLSATLGNAEFRRRGLIWLHPVLVWKEGFHQVERYPGRELRWSRRRSRLLFTNADALPHVYRLRTLLNASRPSLLTVSYGTTRRKIPLDAAPRPVTLDVEVPAGGSVPVDLSFRGPPVPAPGDPRNSQLFFMFTNATVEQIR